MTREGLEKILKDNQLFIDSLQKKSKEENVTIVLTVSDTMRQVEVKDYSNKEIANVKRININEGSELFEDYSYKRN